MRVKAMAYGTSHWHWVILSQTTDGGWHPRACGHGTNFELSGPLETRSPHEVAIANPCQTCEAWGIDHGLPNHTQLMETLRQGAENLASAIRQNRVRITYETDPPWKPVVTP
jgi:hypothetical protein